MKTTQNIAIGARRTINPQEVILLTADVNYTQVHLSNGEKMIVATSLKILEKRFAEYTQFFRTHKSYLINLNYIKQFDAKGTEAYVQMKNDYRVVISRRKKCAFQKRVLLIAQNCE